jgi:hypothetical protein
VCADHAAVAALEVARRVLALADDEDVDAIRAFARLGLDGVQARLPQYLDVALDPVLDPLALPVAVADLDDARERRDAARRLIRARWAGESSVRKTAA